MKNKTALSVRAATLGQMKDICSLAIQAVPELTFEQATIILRNKGEQIRKIREVFPERIESVVGEWHHFYKEVFGLEVDFTGLELPSEREGFDRLIIVAKGLTLNQVYDACAKHFPCWRFADDLDAAIPTNDRETSKSYAIRVRDVEEADEIHNNKSAKDLKAAGIKGETILERMLHELKYFLETGKHLDIQNITLCSGSRDSDGCVPSVCWSDGRFEVYWCYCNDSNSGLRCREAVSL